MQEGRVMKNLPSDRAEEAVAETVQGRRTHGRAGGAGRLELVGVERLESIVSR